MKKATAKIYYILIILSTALYLGWRVLKTLPTDHSLLSMIFAVILIVTEIIGIAEMLVCFGIASAGESDRPDPGSCPAKGLPHVDVFVTTCGEDPALLEQTLTACIEMEYEEGKKHIYLCDDAASPEMQKLSERLGIGYLFRKERVDAKAGNLNNALAHTYSPLVAVFDADMCPHRDYLKKTVPFFIQSAVNKNAGNTGFVQTPQSFKNKDLFQKAFGKRLSNEQDYFYLSLEPQRNEINAVVFGGTNTLLSRKALEKSGGFATGTLTEDFATGIEIEKHGYTCYAISEILAEGLCPEDLPSLIRQRIRWARGCIQSGRRTGLIRSRGLKLNQRLSYISSISYWYSPIKRLIYIAAPMMYPIFGITVMRCDIKNLLAFWLPMYVLTVAGVRLYSGNIRSSFMSDVYELCLFPFLLFPVIAETIGIRKKDFRVTDKSGRKKSSPLFVLPFVLLIALSVYGIYLSVGLCLEQSTTVYLFLIIWLAVNTIELVCAAWFTVKCIS